MPTKDTEVIASVLLNPDVYKDIKGDTEFNREDIDRVKDTPDTYFLEVQGREGTLGIVGLHKIDETAHQAHINMLPQYRGGVANAVVSKVEAWVRYNTRINYLVAEIPHKYKNVLQFVINNGYKQYNSDEDNYYVAKELR